MKSRKTSILDRIKDKLSVVQALNDQKNDDKKKRLEFEKKIKVEETFIDDLDKELLEVIREEKQVYLRILKLCEFLIKYSKISSNGMIINMILRDKRNNADYSHSMYSEEGFS